MRKLTVLLPAALVVIAGAGVQVVKKSTANAFHADGAHSVYRYSVVPGGVWTAQAFTKAKTDPVVAMHYAGLGPMVRMEHLGGNYYDSYRIGSRVYWTSYRVRVASDELAWHETNGYGMIRPRCGNRLSLTPMQPTLSAELEPTPEDLNEVLGSDERPVDSAILPYAPGEKLFTPPGAAAVGIAPAVGGVVPLAVLPVAGMLLPGAGAPPALVVLDSDTARPVIPVATPEPGSMFLFLLGLLGLGYVGFRERGTDPRFDEGREGYRS